MRSVRIEQAVNGFVVTTEDPVYSEDGDFIRANTGSVFVFEEGDNPLECHQGLLYYVLDEFGISGSKHDPKRVRVSIEPNEE